MMQRSLQVDSSYVQSSSVVRLRAKLSGTEHTIATMIEQNMTGDTEQANNNLEYCRAEGSLNVAVFKMTNHSSPPGSASYNMTNTFAFYIGLGAPIFESVQNNIATMMKGFGLQQEKDPTNRSDVICIESSVKPRRCVGEYCIASPRIIIQTEQLSEMGERQIYPLPFQSCHHLDHCIIFDFF